jgi:hypothetical protein
MLPNKIIHFMPQFDYLFKPSFLVYQGFTYFIFRVKFLFGTVFRKFENASKTYSALGWGKANESATMFSFF